MAPWHRRVIPLPLPEALSVSCGSFPNFTPTPITHCHLFTYDALSDLGHLIFHKLIINTFITITKSKQIY